ncbi:MAG TPA: hypothetical protein VK801_11185 [Caulobacteraceae bacterium]|jgi:hypothetical protein|nr:hypothetical protein [Caulobacteraceae bacterium]
MADYDRVARTRTLARIVGPYLVVLGVMLFELRGALPTLLPAFMQDGPLVLASGAFTLMAGLAIICAHHHWTSGSAIVISLIGVAAAIKGAMLMIAPGFGSDLTAVVVRTPSILIIAAVVALLVGLWLSFVGWIRPPAEGVNARP